MIFNTHSHINDKTLDEALSLILECKENGVDKIAVVGYDYESSLRALRLADLYDDVYAICGLQPGGVKDFSGDFNDFIELFNADKCIAIGEIGLDYYYGKEDKNLQLKYFEEQLQIATRYNKPVQIHCRDAYEDTYNLLEKYHKELDGIIMHCYSGSEQMMQRFVKLGIYISISGVVTFKNAVSIKEVVKNCPIDKLLIETDDPYLTPVPFRGKENHPSYVRYVLEEVAKIKEMDVEEVKRIIYENSLRVFHL